MPPEIFINNLPYILTRIQQRKCDAMNWLMVCEKPAVSRLCSAEAADVITNLLYHLKTFLNQNYDCFNNFLFILVLRHEVAAILGKFSTMSFIFNFHCLLFCEFEKKKKTL